MNSQTMIRSAFVGLMALSAVTAATTAQAADEKEKCYGVAKAGQNDCANGAGTHSCAGQSKMDNSADDWKLVPKGSCVTMGGKMSAPMKK